MILPPPSTERVTTASDHWEAVRDSRAAWFDVPDGTGKGSHSRSDRGSAIKPVAGDHKVGIVIVYHGHRFAGRPGTVAVFVARVGPGIWLINLIPSPATHDAALSIAQ
jgi:hypothetical protein